MSPPNPRKGRRDPPPAPPRSPPSRPHLPQPAQSRPGGEGPGLPRRPPGRDWTGAPRLAPAAVPQRVTSSVPDDGTLPSLQEAREAGPPPFRRRSPGGQAHSRRPLARPRWRPPARGAPAVGAAEACRAWRGLPKSHAPLRAQPLAHSGLKSTPSFPKGPPALPHLRKVAKQCGGGQEGRGGPGTPGGFGARGPRDRGRPASWPPVPGATHTHTVRPGGRWPFLLSG